MVTQIRKLSIELLFPMLFACFDGFIMYDSRLSRNNLPYEINRRME